MFLWLFFLPWTHKQRWFSPHSLLMITFPLIKQAKECCNFLTVRKFFSGSWRLLKGFLPSSSRERTKAGDNTSVNPLIAASYFNHLSQAIDCSIEEGILVPGPAISFKWTFLAPHPESFGIERWTFSSGIPMCSISSFRQLLWHNSLVPHLKVCFKSLHEPLTYQEERIQFPPGLLCCVEGSAEHPELVQRRWWDMQPGWRYISAVFQKSELPEVKSCFLSIVLG